MTNFTRDMATSLSCSINGTNYLLAFHLKLWQMPLKQSKPSGINK